MKPGRVFLSGLAAGTAAVILSFALRILAGGFYLPELAASALFSLVPGYLESRAVENLGPLAKDSAFLGASVLNAVVLGLIPVVLDRFGRIPKVGYRKFAAFVVLPFVLMLSLWALFNSLAQVSSQTTGLASIELGLVGPSLVFGLIMGLVRLTPPPPSPVLYPQEQFRGKFSRKRRLFIKSAIATTAGAALLYYGAGLLLSKPGPVGVNKDEAATIIASQVTPNNEFYRVDVNVIPPSVDSSTWSLNLHGLVSNPKTINYGQLITLESIEEYATLECVSNKVGGDLMSTAKWKGVRLKDILASAGVAPGADYVVFRCADGYDVGIPLDRAMMEGTMLAYEMNGTKLPIEHGFPVRAIVPGLYGMMNAKWITDIEVVQGVYDGFWQRRGWANNAFYKTGSTILTPGDSQLRDRFPLPSRVTDISGSQAVIVGAAFAGDRGIRKVEVSTDGGLTWEMASLYDPLSQYTWVFWKYGWDSPDSGNHRLMVRATDGDGQTQVATMTEPFPSGATGYNVVDIRVSDS